MPKSILVKAPADLQEGFTFDVLVEGKPYTVTVPEGGMQQGEEFEIPYEDGEEPPMLPAISSSEDAASNVDDNGAPYGRWRTHWCACCDVVTQATFWMAICCVPVLIAQLLNRLSLNWRGKADHTRETALSYNKILLSYIAILLIGTIIGTYLLVLVYTLVLLLYTGRNLRAHMRKKYNIPSRLPSAVEDCCCMAFCGCCATIQMARHTHNDKEYSGYCCTNNGLEPEAPKVV